MLNSKKNYIIIVITILIVNITSAQLICNISPKVKEVGEEITKEKGSSKDSSVIGDYRINGTGWILLPDHTGAVFIENIQINEIIWISGEINGNQGLEITNLKQELDSNNKLQSDSRNKFLINIKSINDIEFVNTKTLQTSRLKRTQLIKGKIYSKTSSLVTETKPNVIPFSIFSQKYVYKKLFDWENKGEFEKTTDWQLRVTEEKIIEKTDEFKEESIEAYAKTLKIKLGFCYIGASLSLGVYNADKEIYIIKSRDFGDLEVPVPIVEAENFKYQNWCSDESDPTNVIFCIINDKLVLAKLTLWNKYYYENPLTLNRNKTKKEIANELKVKNELDNKNYNNSFVDKSPEFPGGMIKFYEFIRENYRVPKEQGLRGKVLVSFVVDMDGTLIDIKYQRDIGFGTGNEAIRVMKICPKWIPGEHQGKNVKVSYSIPINIDSGY